MFFQLILTKAGLGSMGVAQGLRRYSLPHPLCPPPPSACIFEGYFILSWQTYFIKHKYLAISGKWKLTLLTDLNFKRGAAVLENWHKELHF